MRLWYACDEDGCRCIYDEKPERILKYRNGYWGAYGEFCIKIDCDYYKYLPDVSWADDEPIELELTVVNH